MDNVKEFPARMSDGRFVTNYNSSCVTNLLSSNGMNSYTYRQMLINNAEEIMKETQAEYDETFSCSSCYKMIIPKTKYEQDCSGDVCTIKRVSDGIGIDNV
jgi:hypothetical protein|tara:strand:- start:4372 stop:4674 length:303 start_codon:yes stop_codon:yes gene_type:complete